jgi:hypothetical protein
MTPGNRDLPNLRESVRALLIAAGKDGMTQTEVEAALAARDETRGRFKGGTVSGTLANLCRIGVARRAGCRPNANMALRLVFVATGLPLPLNACGGGRQTASDRCPPLPEDKWPREVRRAVDTLRRRGWGVWPKGPDLWEAGGTRTTEDRA